MPRAREPVEGPWPGEPPTGRFIAGKVCDAAGRPAAARVGARCLTTGRMSETRAAEDGRFALAVGPGEHEVAATAAAAGDAFRRRVFPPARLDLVLTPPARVRGRAVAAGAAIAGVRLRLQKGDGGTDRGAWVLSDFSPREATTAGDGSFEILCNSALDGVIALETAGGPVRVGQRLPLPSSSQETEMTVPVEPARPVCVLGEVRDAASGAPLAGVQVRRDVAAGRTDATGTFRLDDVQPGRGQLEAWVPGRPVYRDDVDVERGSKILVRVPAPYDLDGVVLDEAGAPVPGAGVRWTGAALLSRARADEAGRFRIRGIAPEREGVVQAWAAGFVPAEAWPPPGETRVTVRLRRGGKLTGRVLDPDGTPVAGADVRLAPAGWSEHGPRVFRALRAGTTRDDGSYAFEDLAEGDVWVFAMHRSPHLAPARLRATVPPGTSGQAPDVRLRHAAMLSGVVRDPEGAPVGGAVVRIVSPLRSALAFADGEGRFALPPPAPWKELIVAVAPLYATVSVVVQEGAPVPPLVLLRVPDPQTLSA